MRVEALTDLSIVHELTQTLQRREARSQKVRGTLPPPGALERVEGIEPSYAAWEAAVLPLNYTRRMGASVSFLVMIQVIVNGAQHRLEQPLDVAALIARLELQGKRIAVERNGEIVPRSAHRTTQVADGDRLEIVVAVGGG